ncbi:MAG: nuclease-related domain-containing protein [Chloroflexota bacterium]
MRIAGSATFLADRARRRVTRGGLLMAAGVVFLVIAVLAAQGSDGSGSTGATSLPVFLGLGSLLVGTLQLLAGSRDRQASAGEAPVVTQLGARLDDDYCYLHHVALPQHGVEADGILIGPSGALVLAIRAIAGQYVVRGNDWFTVDAAGTERPWSRSPTWELARPMFALQRIVQEQGFGQVPVHGAVVLVQGQLVEADRPGAAVVPVERIASYADYLRQGETAPREMVEALIAYLEPHAGGHDRRRPGRREQ